MQAPAQTAPSAAPAAPPATSGSTQASPDDRGSAFKAVDNSKESVPGGTLLVAAYFIAFVLMLLFVVRVFRRQDELSRKVDELESAVRKKP